MINVTLTVSIPLEKAQAVISLLSKEPTPEKKFGGSTTEFDSYKFDELNKDEYYLVFYEKDSGEKATVIPSLTWLDCPLTYSENGDITLIQKVKIITSYPAVK